MNNTEQAKHIEIERKFLVKNQQFIHEAEHSSHIVQGYLSLTPEKTVRIRIREDKGYITIKGKQSENGLSRFEWEKEISLDEARELIQLCGKEVIDKTRYLVPFKGHSFEVDVFYGNNEGLIIAEVELKDEKEFFEKPEWIGEEVSQDNRFHNSQLIRHPYRNW